MIVTKQAHHAALAQCKIENDIREGAWSGHIFKKWLLQYGGRLGGDVGGWEIVFDNDTDAVAFLLKFG